MGTVESALKDAGLPPLVWYDVLLELERAGEAGVRPFELERAMLLAQYNLSRLLERIEKESYIERRTCPDDGRGQLLRITESGIRNYGDGDQTVRSMSAVFFNQPTIVRMDHRLIAFILTDAAPEPRVHWMGVEDLGIDAVHILLA